MMASEAKDASILAMTSADRTDAAERSSFSSQGLDLEREHREFGATIGDVTVSSPRMTADNVNVYYGDKQAIADVSLHIGRNEVIAMIGPSGCGKSTFIRCLNRMNDTIESCRVTGDIRLDGEDITDSDLDVVQLRARVGMVFQKPNPFPKSIYDNVAYGPRIHGLASSRTASSTSAFWG